MIEKVVYGMAGVRFLSSLLEMTGAILMLRLGTATKALWVNSMLALVGPVVLVTVTFLGIVGIADNIHWWKIAIIILGVACILFGARG